MNCTCHGEPAYWQKDARLKAGGRWECGVRRRQYDHARYTTNSAYRLEKRRSELRRLRRDTLAQLSQLQEEAIQLGA